MTWIAIALVAAALLLLPGAVVWLLFGPRGMPYQVALAPAFALSLAAISILAWLAYVAGIGFAGLKVAAVATAVVALALTPFAVRRARTPVASGEAALPSWTIWSAVAVAVLTALSALYSGTWISLTADTFYHLAAIRSVLEHGTALPLQVFFDEPVPAPDPTSGTWHSALAIVASLSGADPIDVWRFMTVVTAPLTALAFFVLAVAVTRSGVAAAIATALYMVVGLSLDFRSAANPNRFGVLLGWLALAFVLRFVDNGSRRELVFAVPIAFAASAVHPGQSPFLLATLGAAVLGAVIVRAPSWRRLVLGGAIVGAAALPLFAVNLLTLNEAAPYAAAALAAPLPLRTGHRPWPWVVPTFWYRNVGAVLGTAFAPLLIRPWWAGQAGAGLLLALLAGVPAVALTPVFATTYTGQYLLARVSDVVLPLVWIAFAWAIVIAAGALRGRMRVPATLVLVVAVAAVAAGVYAAPLPRFTKHGNLQSFQTTRTTDLTVTWRDRLDAIAKLPQDAVILAAPDISFELAGLTGRAVVAVGASHTPHQVEVRDGPRRRTDALDAVQGRLDQLQLAAVIEQYGVTDVMVDRSETDLRAWDELATSGFLVPIAGNDVWHLYAFDASRLQPALAIDLHEATGPNATEVGVEPSAAYAGRAVFGRVVWSNPAPAQAMLVADGPEGTFRHSVGIGRATDEIVALPVPLNAAIGLYTLDLQLASGDSIQLGTFDVGRIFQGEDLGGIVPGNGAGWTTTGDLKYQGDLAAVAVNEGAAAHQATPAVAPGSYCVIAFVEDDGTGATNEILVGLGQATTTLSWSGALSGMRDVRGRLDTTAPSGELVMRLVQRDQSRAVVDAIAIFPSTPQSC